MFHTFLDHSFQFQRTNVPSAREPEVLSTMATIVNKLESHITQQVPKIFDAVFECTLNMINKDFEEFPEHRTNFFLLLQVILNFLVVRGTYISKFCLTRVLVSSDKYKIWALLHFWREPLCKHSKSHSIFKLCTVSIYYEEMLIVMKILYKKNFLEMCSFLL